MSMNEGTAELAVAGGCLIPTIAIALAAVAAWVTHVDVCIKTAAWILLAFGCIVAPVGVIHGVGVWLGVW